MKDIMAGIDLHSNNLMLARVRLFLSVSRLIVRMKNEVCHFGTCTFSACV